MAGMSPEVAGVPGDQRHVSAAKVAMLSGPDRGGGGLDIAPAYSRRGRKWRYACWSVPLVMRSADHPDDVVA